MEASEMVCKLLALIFLHGDKKLFHEDNGCQVYSITDVKYDEQEDEFKVQ